MSAVQIGSDIIGESTSDLSGWSTSLNNAGDIVAIGARHNDGGGSNVGHTRVYQYNIGTSSWDQLGSDIDGEALGDNSGYSVSLNNDGDIVAIGAIYNDGAGSSDKGHVRIYQYNSGTSSWSKLGNDIDGEARDDLSGYSVSLSNDGTIVAIGAINNDGGGDTSGSTRIYEYNSGTSSWNQLGSDIDGLYAQSKGGYSVSLNGDGSIVAIGEPYSGLNRGITRIFEYNSGSSSWNQLGSTISGVVNLSRLGWSVSLNNDGTIVAIGATKHPIQNPNGTYTTGQWGIVQVFEYDNGTSSWDMQGLSINAIEPLEDFGYSVSLSNDGTRLAASAPFYNENNDATKEGYVKIFDYDSISGEWSQTGNKIDGTNQTGTSISLSGDGAYLAVGETTYSSNTGRTMVYDLAAICFYPDTNVLTNNGYINIMNLKRGDLIKTNNGFKKLARLLKLRKSKNIDLVLFKKIL